MLLSALAALTFAVPHAGVATLRSQLSSPPTTAPAAPVRANAGYLKGASVWCAPWTSCRARAASAGLPPRLGLARLQYEGGGDWYANPSSLPNLLKAINERTSLRVEPTEGRVTITDEKLYDFAFLHMTGHGVVKFSDAEVSRLREWVLRGGFLHVDDNYGLDETFRKEIVRVFPDRPLVDVPLSHPIYHIVYSFPKGVPKVHEHDGKPARGYGVFVGDRLAVYYTHESDLGNGWEDVGTYTDPPEVHETALRMGINLFVYAVTSRPVS